MKKIAARGGHRKTTKNSQSHFTTARGDVMTVDTEGIAVTIFSDVYSRDKQEFAFSFEELANHVREPKAYPRKAACPLIKLASFGDRPTDKGCLRHDGNVLAVTGIEGDYDAGEMGVAEAAERLRCANVRAILYTSPSHRTDAPRWRVLAPLSKPHAPSERRRFVARINGVLGGVLASESFATSQSFYVGRVNGAPYESHVVNGDCIDTLDQFDSCAKYPEGTAERTTRAERLTDGQINDPVVAHMVERNIVLEGCGGGKFAIVCPFERDHTTPGGKGDCCYFIAHTNGFKTAHFHCLHSHCNERTNEEFLGAIGIPAAGDDADDEGEDGEDKKTSQSSELVSFVLDRAELFHDLNSAVYARDHETKETRRLESRQFRDWLVSRFYQATEKLPRDQAVREALSTLSGIGRFDGLRHSQLQLRND